MKKIGFALALLVAATLSAQAQSKRLEASLRMLDPDTRFDQVCDLAAMKAIRAESKSYRPDRAVGSAVSNPVIDGNTMAGTGGAFRSRGKWYQYAFTCTVTPDRMKVTSFKHKVGAEIPEEKWAGYNLWK